MRIGIKLNNSEIAGDVARRISELYSDIYIVLIKDDSDADNMDILIDENTDFSKPISTLLRTMLLEYEEKTGKKLQNFRKYQTEIFFVFSQNGGSGVSSISTALGRIFAGKEERNVLIVEKGDEIDGYSEPIHLPDRNSRELNFLIEKEKKIIFSRYYYMDRYGPFFITCNANFFEILKLVEEEHFFDIVIFSSFDCNELPVGAQMIYIKNSLDKRTENIACEENTVEVINRWETNGISENKVMISDDEKSFVIEKERVKISMDGNFAKGVENIYRTIRGIV